MVSWEEAGRSTLVVFNHSAHRARGIIVVGEPVSVTKGKILALDWSKVQQHVPASMELASPDEAPSRHVDTAGKLASLVELADAPRQPPPPTPYSGTLGGSPIDNFVVEPGPSAKGVGNWQESSFNWRTKPIAHNRLGTAATALGRREGTRLPGKFSAEGLVENLSPEGGSGETPIRRKAQSTELFQRSYLPVRSARREARRWMATARLGSPPEDWVSQMPGYHRFYLACRVQPGTSTSSKFGPDTPLQLLRRAVLVAGRLGPRLTPQSIPQVFSIHSFAPSLRLKSVTRGQLPNVGNWVGGRLRLCLPNGQWDPLPWEPEKVDSCSPYSASFMNLHHYRQFFPRIKRCATTSMHHGRQARSRREQAVRWYLSVWVLECSVPCMGTWCSAKHEPSDKLPWDLGRPPSLSSCQQQLTIRHLPFPCYLLFHFLPTICLLYVLMSVEEAGIMLGFRPKPVDLELAGAGVDAGARPSRDVRALPTYLLKPATALVIQVLAPSVVEVCGLKSAVAVCGLASTVCGLPTTMAAVPTANTPYPWQLAPGSQVAETAVSSGGEEANEVATSIAESLLHYAAKHYLTPLQTPSFWTGLSADLRLVICPSLSGLRCRARIEQALHCYPADLGFEIHEKEISLPPGIIPARIPPTGFPTIQPASLVPDQQRS
ncbi:hypothetical protein B0T17DRAFT_509307 [Bombardia bombarda]|uniref:Uncharacterized protein n=1 Tax=Bombardia bombarda TaxID=252184 RepID=A0AA39WUW3_9PEZI|nr:hypothetical protein B0T17DRAFT_509307 [Bombardia bombarda]